MMCYLVILCAKHDERHGDGCHRGANGANKCPQIDNRTEALAIALRTMYEEQCATSFPIHVHFVIYVRARAFRIMLPLLVAHQINCADCFSFATTMNAYHCSMDLVTYHGARVCVVSDLARAMCINCFTSTRSVWVRERNSSFFIWHRNWSVQTSPTVSCKQ